MAFYLELKVPKKSDFQDVFFSEMFENFHSTIKFCRLRILSANVVGFVPVFFFRFLTDVCLFP